MSPSQKQTAVVPDVAMCSTKEAGEIITRAGLRVGVVAERIYDWARVGTVVYQRPAAGSKVTRGAVVDLSVARASIAGEGGPAAGTYRAELPLGDVVSREDKLPERADGGLVPNVINLPKSKAVTILKRQGFKIVVNGRQYADQAGRVVDQQPAAGMSSDSGTVLLAVAISGKPLIHVPNVINQSLDSAETTLATLGFKVGATQNRFDSTAKLDTEVVDQQPAAGSEEERGTEVDLLVIVGPVIVPELRKKPLSEAAALLKSKRLRTSVHAWSSRELPSTVLSQSPASGEKVNPGTEVKLAVAMAPDKHAFFVPNVMGWSQAAAERQLEAAYLKVGVIEQKFHKEAKSGGVIDQDPVPGSFVEAGTRINLTVAISEGREAIQIPDVTQRSKSEAETILWRAGFKIGDVKKQLESATKPGTVIDQKPAPGSKVERGTSIDLTVSATK